MYEWAMIPVLERKDLRDENLLAIGEREERFAKRYDEIKRAADEIARVLDENYKLFFDLLPQSEYTKDEFELEGKKIYTFVRTLSKLFSFLQHQPSYAILSR